MLSRIVFYRVFKDVVAFAVYLGTRPNARATARARLKKQCNEGLENLLHAAWEALLYVTRYSVKKNSGDISTFNANIQLLICMPQHGDPTD